MILRSCLAALLALGAIQAAQAGMTAEEFDAFTRGKTLYFSENGQEYGVERYLEGRRVQWSFLDGECKDGIWYPEDGNICFIYEDLGGPQCWRFEQVPGGLAAEFMDDPENTSRFLAYERDAPMLCFGPDTGV